MAVFDFIIFILVGLFSGVISGLFGVGGGTVIVPALVFVFLAIGFPKHLLMQFAIGTSFALIVVNSAFAAWEHFRRHSVNVEFARWAAPFMMLGVLLGSMGALSLEQAWLVIAFSVFLTLVALQMYFGWKPRRESRSINSKCSVVGVFSASLVGGVSAFFGIAGGSMIVPWLSTRGFDPHTAVGTSSMCGVFLSLFGAFSYAFATTPDIGVYWHTGFVYWPAVIVMMIASYPGVKVGAAIAHRLSGQYLKRIFSAYLLLVVAALNGVI